MATLRLVKNNNKIILPKPKLRRNIRSTILRAIDHAIEQDWDSIIIIGQGKEQGGWNFSPMLDTKLVGMLEIAKKHILEDECIP
jgi:hypothetical protein